MTDYEIVRGLLECKCCPLGAAARGRGFTWAPHNPTLEAAFAILKIDTRDIHDIAGSWDSFYAYDDGWPRNENGRNEAVFAATRAGLRDDIEKYLLSLKSS